MSRAGRGSAPATPSVAAPGEVAAPEAGSRFAGAGCGEAGRGALTEAERGPDPGTFQAMARRAGCPGCAELTRSRGLGRALTSPSIVTRSGSAAGKPRPAAPASGPGALSPAVSTSLIMARAAVPPAPPRPHPFLPAPAPAGGPAPRPPHPPRPAPGPRAPRPPPPPRPPRPTQPGSLG